MDKQIDLKQRLEMENRQILDREASKKKLKLKAKHADRNTSSFMTLDRTKVLQQLNPVPAGNNNFGIYRPRYS